MAVENGSSSTNDETTTVAPAVTVTGTRTVAPGKSRCTLATFDLPYITFYYNQKLLLYRNPSNAAFDFPDAVARITAALSDALRVFYPLAGRIRQDANGALAVEGDEGAEVLEAEAEGVSVEDLAGGDCGEEAERVMQHLVPYTGVMNLEGLRRPLLAVQLTKLKDGLAVGCAFNHAVLDGSSTWHFMSYWAELSRTKEGALLLQQKPIHDRSLARSVRVRLDLPESAEAHEKTDPNGPKKALVARVFSFPEATVGRIKAAANAALPPGAKPFSTFQSLGAHIWRAVSRARGLGPADITAFAVFADCRARLDPPLPPAYFGNLIQAVFTGVPAGMLLGGPPELAAGLLQKAIDDHDAAAVVRRLEEYEAAPKLFHYSDAGPNCVAVGSSPRFKVYDVDFGFGRPERVRSGGNNKFDGMVYLYPGRSGDGGIDVELALQPEPMQRLEKDADFLLL
ncbi:BAHD acyltransferase DCR [Dichanthelium oligosanthes]|uniref:BAHD acyltransferase DCR n=1 Tax=Dichanthelium oligosanthes TaxID=888268 RepID=A0A1E5WL25_9POAL|nr:BAHD acyltransferase DCR [Dichanthelium oligosanthes]